MDLRYLLLEIPDSQEESEIPSSQEEPNSKEQPDSQEQSILRTPTHHKSITTTRDDRIAIKTALLFKIPYPEICKKLGVTMRQIQLARNSQITPQKSKCGRKPLIRTPKRRELETWLLELPSHRRIRYNLIPFCAPHLGLEGVGYDAIHKAFTTQGYVRRTSKKKGFSNDLDVMAERVEFAREGITWIEQRLFQQMFIDEVQAMGGLHTVLYVTVKEDGSDRYNLQNVAHKHSKAPAWMFHGSIVNGRKGPAVFWEKDWGNMKSSTYDIYILAPIAEFLHEHPDYIFMQDNASCHRLRETKRNLQRRGIRYIRQPRYSPDLNLIKHVWNWMKNWIEDRYWQTQYNVAKIPLSELKRIIWEAWEACPEDYICTLYSSWWRRCQAVIDANGGPTKY